MNLYIKTLSSSVVLMTSILMVSCSQSTDEQTGTVDTNEPVTTTPTSTPMTSRTGPYVALSKSDINVYQGDTFTLDVLMSDFTSTTEGGGVSLQYDPALLQVTSVNVDNTVWDFKNKNGHINNVEGTVSDILFSNYRGVTGDARITTIEFKSIKKGSGTITLQESSANPFAGNGQIIAVSFETTTVAVN